MKIAYFDCFSGASGDMIVGALLDAGVKLSVLRKELAALKVRGLKIKARRVQRGMLSATKFDVETSHHHHEHRTLREIEKIIQRSALSDRAKEDSRKVFLRLARAEAKVHRTKPENVAFHEVGAADSIADIVGAAVGLDQLGVDKVCFSPPRLGTGTVTCRHGVLPLPAPATVELLKGVPVVQTSIESELTTPTGAAVLTALGRCAPPPPMRYTAVGYGAGSRDRADVPNALRLIIGEACPTGEGDRVAVIETNIDDMSPEIFGHVFERLFAVGALDVFTVPIQMKKNRPGVLLTAIVECDGIADAEEVIFTETTTFGIRRYEVERSKLSREERKVRTRYGVIRVKIGRRGGEVKTIAPEYDDCRKAAERTGASLKAVFRAASGAARDVGEG